MTVYCSALSDLVAEHLEKVICWNQLCCWSLCVVRLWPPFLIAVYYAQSDYKFDLRW